MHPTWLGFAVSGAGSGEVGNVEVDGFSYQDEADLRLQLYVSTEPFPEAAGARMILDRPNSPWMASSQGIDLLCAQSRFLCWLSPGIRAVFKNCRPTGRSREGSAGTSRGTPGPQRLRQQLEGITRVEIDPFELIETTWWLGIPIAFVAGLFLGLTPLSLLLTGTAAGLGISGAVGGPGRWGKAGCRIRCRRDPGLRDGRFGGARIDTVIDVYLRPYAGISYVLIAALLLGLSGMASSQARRIL